MLQLTTANLVHYLVSRGLVEHTSLVDGDFLVIDVSRRNRNFKVVRSQGRSLFVKQARFCDSDSVSALQREAACYRLAQADARFGALAPLVPMLQRYDPQVHVLVLDLLPLESETLQERYERLGHVSPDLAGHLGTALGEYQAGVALEDGASTAFFPKRLPWILSFHAQQRQRLTTGASRGGSIEQLRMALRQFPEFPERLEQLRREWKADCLIHGDMRWDNCVIYPDPEARGELRLKVIDWELADWGDAGWDLGGVLQAYLCAWVLSMPGVATTPAAELVAHAQCPLDRIQPAIQAFWRAYADRRALAVRERHDLLGRAVRYGAARLIQTVYESLVRSPQLDFVAVRLLQLSYNVLARPGEAIEFLLTA